MASTDADILQEFLIAIGFKIDEAGGKKFTSLLSEGEKQALKVGGAVIGVGYAVEKFVTAMSNGLARLFYMSERTDATVAGIKAMGLAFENVGLKAGVAEEAITGIAQMLRKPGTESLLRGWGINTGQPTEKVTLDVEDMLAKMYQAGGGQRYTAIALAQDWLKMSEEDFVQMTKELPNLHRNLDQASERLKETGVDVGEVARQSVEFNRVMNRLGQDIGNIGLEIHAKTLPVLTAFFSVIEDWAHHVAKGDFWKSVGGDIGMMAAGLSEEEKPAPPTAPKTYTRDELMREAMRDAALYGLDAKTFIGQIQTESGFNPNAASEAGAVGIGQFLPGTARGRGFEAGADPIRDLREAARLMRELIDRYHGNVTDALMAYHAGAGNVDNYLSGQSSGVGPRTQAYPNSVYANAQKVRLGTDMGGRDLVNDTVRTEGSKVFAPQVTNNFNISGSDANAISDATANKVQRKNSDLFRDGIGMLAN